MTFQDCVITDTYVCPDELVQAADYSESLDYDVRLRFGDIYSDRKK